jgi:hypothetical protein
LYQEKKVCKKCEREYPATSEFFHANKKNGRSFLYSVCKDCKRKKYVKRPPRINKRRLLSACKTKKVNDKKCVHCKQNKPKGRNKYCDQCKHELVTRICVKCNNEFSIERYLRTKCCSDECKGKDSIRKKRIYDEVNNVYLSRNEVLTFEGYKCKNCGCTTDKKLGYVKGTLVIKPSSPTIDHIIPLSLGGTHTLKNVQLLCYRCNHEKQDGYLQGGEQLKMF